MPPESEIQKPDKPITGKVTIILESTKLDTTHVEIIAKHWFDVIWNDPGNEIAVYIVPSDEV